MPHCATPAGTSPSATGLATSASTAETASAAADEKFHGPILRYVTESDHVCHEIGPEASWSDFPCRHGASAMTMPEPEPQTDDDQDAVARPAIGTLDEYASASRAFFSDTVTAIVRSGDGVLSQ